MGYNSWAKKAALILIQLALTGILVMLYISSSQYEKQTFLSGNWGLASILMTVWVFVSWGIITSKLLSYYTVFFLIAVLFHFGQFWAQFLSPGSVTYVDLTEFYSLEKINVASFYSACCLMIFHLAVMIIATINIHKKKRGSKFKTGKEPLDMNLLLAFGVLLFFFSVIPKIAIDIKLYGYVSQGGYLAIYSNPLTGPIWRVSYILAGFFYPSIYILLYCFKNNKVIWNILFYGIVSYCLAYGFVVGNRGIMFMLIVALILYRHFIYKKFTRKELVWVGIFSVFVLMFSSVIALTRITARNEMSIDAILENIKGYNLIYGAISEFGGTAMTLLVGKSVVPEVLPYGQGITYLASTALLIPDPLGVFSVLYPQVTFSGVLNNFHTGLGGSFIAEAYYNFGNLGFAVIGALGLIIGAYLIRMDLKKFQNDYSTSVIWASLMYLALLMYVRDQFYSITSGLIQYFIYPWILYLIFKKILTLDKRHDKQD